MQVSSQEGPSDPPQSNGAKPNMVPTAPIRVDGNCPKEGVELVLTNSTTSVISFETSLTSPPAIKYCPPEMKM